MIEKIQFYGITRRPSDLSSKEGACEESLNVMMDVGEIAPMLEPEDRTAELVGDTSDVSSNITDRYIYIHKTASYSNYIAMDEASNQIVAYVDGERSSVLVDMYTNSETYKDITSVGNTLIVSTDKNIHYILYKDGEYSYLGTKIPEPVVDFRAVPAPDGVKSDIKTCADMGSDFQNDPVAWCLKAASEYDHPEDFWNKICARAETYIEGDYSVNYPLLVNSVTQYIWTQYNRMKTANIKSDVFSNPVFIRSAIRLYDESLTYQSVPYLLHAGTNASLIVNTVEGQTDDDLGIQSTLGNVYQCKVSLSYPDLGNWSDIIRSVDFFVSQDINNPKVNAQIAGAVDEDGVIYIRFLDQTGTAEFNDIKDDIMSKVNFYLVDSKSIEDIGSGTSFVVKPAKQDDLLVKESLLDDNLSHHYTRPKDGITAYNSRLVLRGLVTEIYSGHPFLQSMNFKSTRTGVFVQDIIEYRYFIRTDDGESYSVIGRNSTGGQQFQIPVETVGDTLTFYGQPMGFLYYPDPRCYRVEIYYGSVSSPSSVYAVPMKEHPGLNGAYALCSLAEPVSSLGESVTASTYPSSERKVVIEDNKLVMSEALNPFSMLLANRQTFTDAILAVATTTKALSTGQFGQFPLYVFTGGGIWAVPITNTGAMSSAVPVSRDVALSSESVTPIDQAIVFVSEKGVMLLSGSDVTELSPEMDGRHYVIEEEASDLLIDTEWEKYISLLADSTPFITFMRKARAAYDYAGRRLVFFSDANAICQTYQYVYKLDTQSWHKMCLSQTGFGYANVLNGYPDALVSFRNSHGVFIVCDLSVRYDAGADPVQQTLSQVVITRPYNFNLAHVSKTIKRMFVRGIAEKGNVKFILLGSSDGINYHVIHSLRGPSNNIFFRAMLFGTLTATERVSYLEMDYEPRFTNKPR